MWQCSQQHTNREEAKFCAKCGEKRVIRELCSECGTILEPEDVFCTACGHRRASAVAVEAVAPPAVAPIVAPEPVREVPPAPAAVAPVAAPPAPEPAPTAAAEEEPVTFSFGGALIEMKDESKAAKSAKAAAGSASGESKSGMSSTTTGILSFVIFAAVLGVALYLFSR